MRAGKPVPSLTPENAPFYQGLREHAMRLQRCVQCSAFRYPPSDRCSHCLSNASTWHHMSGLATVYSWTVLHHVYHPAFASDVPYNIAVVQLEEGPRLITNIIGCQNADIYIGMPVEVEYVDVSDEITLAKFRPRHETPSSSGARSSHGL